MGINRRGKVWWVSFSGPDGKRVRKSAGTDDEQAAQELHDRLKAEAWGKGALAEKRRYMWDDAVVQWCKEKKHKASFGKDKEIFRWVDRYLRGRPLADIDRSLLTQVLEDKAEVVTEATANRYMALVRSVLRRACEEWEWVERVPKAPMYEVQSKRTRWLTREEAVKLLLELGEHHAEMMRFTLATGLRQRNVCRLRWTAVDLERNCAWVYHDESKSKQAISVPLCADAIAVLQRQMGRHEQFVFTYRGKPVSQVNTKAWRAAVARAGLEDLRWHDLRHTWASWHVQRGTPLNVLQELGGWKSLAMVQRYAHLTAAHLLPYAQRLEGALEA